MKNSSVNQFLLGMFTAVHNERNWNRLKNEMIAGFESRDKPYITKIRHSPDFIFSFNVDELPKKFEKPSLILTGRQDGLVGYKDAWNFLDNYPRASFIVLDMSGHALQIEQETLFNALVKEWLGRMEY